MKYLQSNPNIARGDFTIMGTRIRISQVVRMLASGINIEEMAGQWWPWLSIETLRGAIDEASNTLEPAVHTTHA
jgi:uncharacterized protein (DUF433 family)